MKRFFIISMCTLCCNLVFSQETQSETKKDTTLLQETIVIAQRKLSNYRQEKTLSSIDAYLEKANKVTMIKRGNYAWEPSINNMMSDRLNVTIDGMQIFGACTDKMDPITSYVDVSNLEQVSINSGQEGAENGHCVGGGIDLQIAPSKFYNSGLKTNIDLGYETNGDYKTTGLDLEYSSNKFYLNTDAIFRKSDNYKAGDKEEILYSQFQKYNISLLSGYKLANNHTLESNIIYDKATDVGYPALPMDVSLAEALITSVTHRYKNDVTRVKSLESKLYFNTITHIMDDSNRPEVPIRMDMPGWSDTYGFYSKVTLKEKKHNLLVNLNGFYNKSLAEMTMYPNDPNQPDMFMYTWPDIRTLYTGLFINDNIALNAKESISTSLRLGFHQNKIAKKVGVESLQIFHPDISDSKNRFLLSLSGEYTIKKDKFDATLGIGYGERAPSVSEGYGFFLFNSFDNYDYIGNPNLKNEKALEFNSKINFKFKALKLGIVSSFFHVSNYIIGEIDDTVNPMTIGANGVRIYEALKHASIFNTYLNTSYDISKKISFNSSIGYNYGVGSNNTNLSLIRPLSYLAEINYSTQKFNAALQLEGNGNQSEYSSFYGEDETPAYAILNLNMGNIFHLRNNRLVFKYGIENILDANYSTYADWNNISRQGRNFYLNMSYIIF
ncbi:TonB-dependent receptor plug domain-containing protein [Flavivirga algicola]|uniref:TonB-dependent receptor n=1 Tax=Flavivirga algicola TaxID=2729136 RepID=A0ABX1RWT7_9FLAO|nr:TonB-dependent receptor plug domain-containing protein [Flavivirga algicola]NMH87470.1 TonB-dependent receptor [Flavivirga algicola]